MRAEEPELSEETRVGQGRMGGEGLSGRFGWPQSQNLSKDSVE